MKERTREEPHAIADSAERQMRRWLMMREIEERKGHECPPEKFRIDEMARRRGLSYEQAKKLVEPKSCAKSA